MASSTTSQDMRSRSTMVRRLEALFMGRRSIMGTTDITDIMGTTDVTAMDIAGAIMMSIMGGSCRSLREEFYVQ